MNTGLTLDSCGTGLTHRAMWMVLFFTLFAGAAVAGTTGTEFKPIFDLLTGWIGGYLGRTIALAAFIIGVGYGAFNSLHKITGTIGDGVSALALDENYERERAKLARQRAEHAGQGLA